MKEAFELAVKQVDEQLSTIEFVLCAAVALVMFALGIFAIRKNSTAKETECV